MVARSTTAGAARAVRSVVEQYEGFGKELGRLGERATPEADEPLTVLPAEGLGGHGARV